jgi:translation initiation factor IF-2
LYSVNDKTIKKGLPSQPVRIIGFKTPPKAGDPIVCVASEEIADDLVARRLAIKQKQSPENRAAGPKANFSQVIVSGRESMTVSGTEKKLEKYGLNLDDTGPIRIPVIVKAHADGSVAAVRDSLCALGQESSFEILVDTIAEGVGPLTRTEVEMAKESNAAIFCFGIKQQDKAVLSLAEADGIFVHQYDIIYSLLDDAKEVFTGYLPAVPTEIVHGSACVKAVFDMSGGKDSIAGLKVLDGTFHRSEVLIDDTSTAVHFRVIRNGERVSPEKLRASSLRKFKEDVDSVRHGDECGLALSDYVDFKEDDIIECYSIVKKKSFA